MTEEQKHFSEHYLLYAYYKVDELRVPTLEETIREHKLAKAALSAHKEETFLVSGQTQALLDRCHAVEAAPWKLRKVSRDADLRGTSQSLHQRSASMDGSKNLKNEAHSRMPSLSGMLSTAKRLPPQRRGSDETVVHDHHRRSWDERVHIPGAM